MTAESMHHISVQGATLRVVVVGDPVLRPLVVLHGGPGDSHETLRPTLDGLATGRCVVYVDQRGCGGSSLDPGTPLPTARDLVGDIEALREWLRAERLDLLGFSWGSTLALMYGEQHAKHIASLALISPSLAGFAESRSFAERLAAAVKRPAVAELQRRLASFDPTRADAAEVQRVQFAIRVAAFFADPERVADATPSSFSPAVARSVEDSIQGWSPAAAIAALRDVPALVVRGAEDPIPPEVAASLATALGAEPVAIIDHAGHAPFVEAPDAFVAIVDRFLADTSGATQRAR